jgi:hypothetical protein
MSTTNGTGQNLTSMIRDITYFFIKYYYDKELINTNQKLLPENTLKTLIDNLYNTKTNELKKYVRETLKENLGVNYNSFAVENIILEMFDDPEYSKHRIFLEIIEYQKKL